MNDPDALVLSVLRFDAADLRATLQQHLASGIWFTERREWLLWRRFTVSGPQEAMAALRQALDVERAEAFWDRVW